MRLAKEIWMYRGYISGCVKREFQAKYRNSILGLAWNVINPIAMILVYTVVFSKVMRARLPGVDDPFAYGIYLCAGVFAWALFVEITTRSQVMFIENANLLKKVKFPKICIPATIIFSSLLNFLIVFGLFTLFLLVNGSFPGFVYLSLIPLLVLLLMFSAGLGMVLGVLNVFFRDVGQGFAIVIMFWFWMTPIVYSPSILPTWAQHLLLINPLAPLISAMQGVLVRGIYPSWWSLAYTSSCVLLLCTLGLRLYRRHSFEIVDEL